MICPVCKNQCNTGSPCGVCAFVDNDRVFINREEAEKWKNEVLMPYQVVFFASVIKKIELDIDWSFFNAGDEHEFIHIFNEESNTRRMEYEAFRRSYPGYVKRNATLVITDFMWESFVSELLKRHFLLWGSEEYSEPENWLYDGSSWELKFTLDKLPSLKIEGQNGGHSKVENEFHYFFGNALNTHNIETLQKFIPSATEISLKCSRLGWDCERIMNSQTSIEQYFCDWELDISESVYEALKSVGINSVLDLFSKSPDEIKKIEGILPSQVEKIYNELCKLGWEFYDEYEG